MSVRATLTPIVYPESDGRPMAESDLHIDTLASARERLKARYAHRSDVYAGGNLLFYYVEGRPRYSLSPDGFVVFGVPAGDRRVYKSWVEGKLPDVVFEFTSSTTQREDLEHKFDIYQDVWKVKEYFLFDPTQDYLTPPLVGYRRVKGKLEAIKPTGGALLSKVLGLRLSADGQRLVMHDAATGEELLTAAERVVHTEAELARLKAELAALRKKAGN